MSARRRRRIRGSSLPPVLGALLLVPSLVLIVGFVSPLGTSLPKSLTGVAVPKPRHAVSVTAPTLGPSTSALTRSDPNKAPGTGEAGTSQQAAPEAAAASTCPPDTSQPDSADASVDPVLCPDNPKCPELGLLELTTFQPVNQGPSAQDGVLIVVMGTSFDWFSPVTPIDAVIVKAGNMANIYFYDEALFDFGLVTPTGPQGQNLGFSHISFCYDPWGTLVTSAVHPPPQSTPPSTTPPETTPPSTTPPETTPPETTPPETTPPETTPPTGTGGGPGEPGGSGSPPGVALTGVDVTEGLLWIGLLLLMGFALLLLALRPARAGRTGGKGARPT